METSYTLINNNKIPIIGLGTSDMENVAEVVYHSIKEGVRLIDTAAIYGTEEGIGQGIARAIKEGIVTREDLFVITKLSPYTKDDIEGSIKASLAALNLTYVDLYLDHWPSSQKTKNGKKYPVVPLHIFWPKMEEAVEKGYTKSLGVSNYNVQSLCNLLSFCKVKPVVLEVEFHPYLYQKNLLDFCNKENIRIIAYNPLVRGPYCEKFHKEVYVDLLNEDIIKELAKKYNKTQGQIALNWIICLGVIPIPRTSKIDRMKENLGAATFRLTDEEVKKISALNKNYRFCSSLNWESFSGIDLFA